MTPTTRQSARAVSFSIIESPKTQPSANPTTESLESLSLSSHRNDRTTPLGSAKIISVSRRGVMFSPRNDTKLFNSSESISPQEEKEASCSSYKSSSPLPSSSQLPCRLHSLPETPPVRSILKSYNHEIRVAVSVEEGTMNNKEPARLLVTGKRSRAIPRDMFRLRQFQRTASEPGLIQSLGEGVDDLPGSDDSHSSDQQEAPETSFKLDNGGDLSEEEEEIECLHLASLVTVILDGAEDLLTLEEAYNSLALRLRESLPITPLPAPLQVENEVRSVTQPLRDQAPAFVRAILRDLHRLMGKTSSSEIPISREGHSPFRAASIACDHSPIPRDLCTLSPTPTRVHQGYTEAEVRYRRDASGIGSAALRLLAFIFHVPSLYSCFSEADLRTLLDQVLIIPRTPLLPTPNPKRTYYLSILILAQIKVPEACIKPATERIVRVIESALNDTLGLASFAGKDGQGPGQIKKEALGAVANLMSTYPALFFPHYAEILPGCLRNLTSHIGAIRTRAFIALSTVASVKLNILSEAETQVQSDPTTRHDWDKTKTVVQKCEHFTVNHLRGTLIGGGGKVNYGAQGEKYTLWAAIESTFRQTVGSPDDVVWACASWAILVSLIGSAYNSSTLSRTIDHIMDRSLQPSTNTVRPTLACFAWQHAIYSYLISGASSSLAQNGRIIRSYNTLSATLYQNVTTILKTILLPIDLALRQANDPGNVTRTLVSQPEFNGEQRWTWRRSEKSRKQAWTVTTGLSAAAIVYAYTVVALNDEEQQVAEGVAIRSQPSPNSLNSDLPPEERRLPKLDATFDNVLVPMLKSFFAVCGIDRLKLHGWQILEAITASPRPNSLVQPLERLLSRRYLDGEVLLAEPPSASLISRFELDRIMPSEIPAWGKLWVAKRLGKLLSLFQEAFDGICGITELSSVEWVTDSHGIILLPTVLSHVWENMLRALAFANVSGAAATPVFMAGLQAIVNQLLDIFKREPSTYIPVCLLDSHNRPSLNADVIRLGILRHLIQAASAILGDAALASTRINLDLIHPNPRDLAIAQSSFGNDSAGHPTVVGSLLGHLLRAKLIDPVDFKVRPLLRSLTEYLLNAGSSAGVSSRLLGDITNSMPWIFEDYEEVQLDIWRLLAIKWTEVIDLQPSATVATTNHTGVLLVNLLSGPFRGRSVSSVWHQEATKENLEAWQALLKATILRFRAKRVGSNFGVLESLAGHLGDFLVSSGTKSSTITLSCLASAVSWISFVPPEQHHTAHYNINENYIPVDFLSLASDALIAAYHTCPENESQPFSTAATKLLNCLATLFSTLPPELVCSVLMLVRPALSVWLADEIHLAEEILAKTLDDLYVSVLKALANAIEKGHIAVTSSIINELIDLYGPRLLCTQNPSVSTMFQTFWCLIIRNDHNLELSDDVTGFLSDAMTILPGLYGVDGQSAASPIKSDTTRAPTLKFQSQFAETNAVTELGLYSGHDTANFDKAICHNEVLLVQQPAFENNSETGHYLSTLSCQPQEMSESGDVFGPSATTIVQKGKNRTRNGPPTVTGTQRHEGEHSIVSPGLGNTAVNAEDVVDVVGRSIGSGISKKKGNLPGQGPSLDMETIHPRSSLLSSASRWLSRVPSIGALFSPTMPPVPLQGQGHRDGTPAMYSNDASPASFRQTITIDVNDAVACPQEQCNSEDYIPLDSRSDAGITARSVTKRRSLSNSFAAIKRFRLREGNAESSTAASTQYPFTLIEEADILFLNSQTNVKCLDAKVTESPGFEKKETAILIEQGSQLSTGTIEDTDPATSLHVAGTSSTSPIRRTAIQSRVLAMLEEAAGYESAIQSLDLAGIASLMDRVDHLRSLATSNLQKKAEDACHERRRQIGKS